MKYYITYLNTFGERKYMVDIDYFMADRDRAKTFTSALDAQNEIRRILTVKNRPNAFIDNVMSEDEILILETMLG